ncbi:MAG: oxidoreductase [Lachnospiraceae bacterium]|nr:oxidoreductase [Lachnospiraceae bacterium]
MATLSVYLSPFAPDYSGVSSVMFDLNTVTAMHDASGCTGNYTGYDEPRWYGSKSPIYCSGLREIDAILGDDEKLIGKMLNAAKDIKPDLMAVVGSPVPMVIGSDMVGIAEELQARSGIPALGFDTTGTAYYDKGVTLATIALLKKFTSKGITIPSSLNILGANPLDFGKGGNLESLKGIIEDRGYEVIACLSMGYDMEALRMAGRAQINLAVSRAGYLIAEYMYQEYGIPYLCGLPFGKVREEEYMDEIRNVMETGRNKIWKGDTYEESEKKILIIGEQVQSNSIREALETEYGERSVVVGCIFGKEENLSSKQDVLLECEKDIIEEMNSGNYKIIIADPFMKQLMKEDNFATFAENALYAVSSKICAEETPLLMGEHFNKWWKKYKSN